MTASESTQSSFSWLDYEAAPAPSSALSVNASVFVPAATSVQQSRTKPKQPMMRRNKAINQQSDEQLKRTRPNAIKKQKPPTPRVPTGAADGRHPSPVRLAGIQLVRSKSDRERLLQLAADIMAADNSDSSPKALVSTPMPITEPDIMLDSASELTHILRGVPLQRSAASELALILGADCSL